MIVIWYYTYCLKRVYIIILNKFVFLANFFPKPVGIIGAQGFILTPDS